MVYGLRYCMPPVTGPEVLGPALVSDSDSSSDIGVMVMAGPRSSDLGLAYVPTVGSGLNFMTKVLLQEGYWKATSEDLFAGGEPNLMADHEAVAALISAFFNCCCPAMDLDCIIATRPSSRLPLLCLMTVGEPPLLVGVGG